MKVESARSHQLPVEVDGPTPPTGPLRLRGGGGDGGATGAESRSAYLEMYKEKGSGKVRSSAQCRVWLTTRLQLDPREELLAVWTCCRLTRQPLGGADGKEAVVRTVRPESHADFSQRLLQAACQLGYLYNREAVLQKLKEHLVDGLPLPEPMKHVATLRDLTTLRLARSDGAAAADHAAFACPLTGSLLNGRTRFVALRPSGVVVAERALKAAPEAVVELLGGGALADQTVVPLNGSPEEVEALLLVDAEAKSRKRRRKGEGAPSAISAAHPRRSPAAAPACLKAVQPAGATAEVWASLFTSAAPARPETFGARTLTFRR